MLDLQPGDVHKAVLPLGDTVADRGPLMATMEKLNQRYGKGALILVSAGTAGDKRTWSMR